MPIKIRKIFIILLLLLTPTIACAVEETTAYFSLSTCIEKALVNSPKINIAKNYKKIAKTLVGQAKSDYFPSLSMGGGYTLQDTKNSGSNFNTGSIGNNYGQVNLSVNQLIWNFGKTIAKINMQKYNMQSVGYDLDYAILTTVYDVKSAYYSVLAAKANYETYERTSLMNKLHYDRTKAMFQEGLKSKIDVVNAEVYYTDAQIQVISSETTYNLAQIALNNTMFYTNPPKYEVEDVNKFRFYSKQTPAEKNIYNVSRTTKAATTQNTTVSDDGQRVMTIGIEKRNIMPNFIFEPFKIKEEEAINLAYENRPDFKSLLMVEKAQTESLKAIKRQFMPELGVSGGYSFRGINNGSTNSLNATIGLNFPAINALDIKYKIDEGKYYLDIATNNIDLSRKNIYFEVQNNYRNMLQYEKKIPLMSKKVEQSLENFELADGRYAVGLGNFIELQNAQVNYVNSQLAYIQSVYDYNIAKAKLERSMGIKWENQV